MSDNPLLRDIEGANPVMPYLRQDRIPHIWCRAAGSAPRSTASPVRSLNRA